ncbi:MAG: hypothetical protein QXQ53_02250 [Candidatus Methanosuratincola sp.]
MPTEEKKKLFQKSPNAAEITQKLSSNVASTREKLGKLASEASSAARNPSDKKSRKRLPAFISAGLAFLIGLLVDGAVGLVLAVVVGLLVQRYFGQLKIPIRPPRALLSFLLAPVSRLLLVLGLLLPFGNGLTLATGHYPDTLMKYLSIVIVLPENLLATSGKNWWFGTPDYYPGAPLIVSISIILMFIGALRIQRTKYLKFFIAGLVLYTLSPTISYLITTGKIAAAFYSGFYAVGFFVTWAGLILYIASKYFGRKGAVLAQSIRAPALKIPPLRRGSATLLSSAALAFGISAITQFMQIYSGAPFLVVRDEFFEVFHHGIASVASGSVAGVAAYGFMSGTDWSGEEGLAEEQGAFEGEYAPSGSSEAGVPMPSPDPNDPPGTTVQTNPDGTVVKTTPDGTKGTLYSDGTVHIEKPDGTTYTEYPDGTSKTYMPDGTVETEYPDGRVETRVPDGRVGITYPDGTRTTQMPDGSSVTLKPDGTVTETKADGSSETWDKDGHTISKTIGTGSLAGLTLNKNPDGTFTVEDGFGGKATFDPDSGTIDGTVTNKDGTSISGTPDGTYTLTNKDGKFTLSEDGLNAEFSDGSKANVDKDGNITMDIPGTGRAEFDSSQGKWTMKDLEGNSMDLNKDGSCSYKDKDGSSIEISSDGSYSETQPDGTAIQMNPDGTTTVANPDGSSLTLGKDGSLTVRGKDGTSKTFTPDEVKTMNAKSSGGK